MTTCPIFATFLAASRINNELDALLDEFQTQLLSNKLLSVDKKDNEWEFSDDDYYEDYRYCTYYCKVTARGSRGRSRSRWLTLHFDLVRDVMPESKWTHARDALLVIAYASDRNDWWEGEELRVASAGVLEDEKLWNDVHRSASCGGKLIVWNENGAAEGDWLFAVPLRLIENSDSLKRDVVAPVLSLLFDHNPEQALDGSRAVEWQPRLAGTTASA